MIQVNLLCNAGEARSIGVRKGYIQDRKDNVDFLGAHRPGKSISEYSLAFLQLGLDSPERQDPVLGRPR